jgi:integrase
MPRKKLGAAGNVYQQAGRAGYIIRWIDSTGRRRSRSLTTATLKEAHEALAAEKHSVEKAKILGAPLPSDETFSDWAEEFLLIQHKRITSHVVRGKLSKAEYERQRGIVAAKLKPHFGTMKLAQVRKADVIRYIHDRTGQISDATVIKEINVLKRMFHLAMDLDKIHSNPAARAPLPKAAEGRTRYLTPDEWKRVFEACAIPPDLNGAVENQWLQQAAGLSVSLGTRRGELMHTTVPDVDLDQRKVILRKTKNGKVRVVYINDLALAVFASMNIAERKRKQDRRVLFPGITPEQVSMRFLRACRAAGVEDFKFHDLRHTWASHMRMQGADLHDLMVLMGHSDMRMTTRYAHLSEEHLRAATSRLDGVLTLPDVTK